MRRQTAVALAASALTTVSVAFFTPSSSADLVTYCIGSGGAVTVPGDLFVPPEESCSLEGTTVTGTVRVAAGASLMVNGGTFRGEVRVATDGYLDSTNTTIDGQITLAPGGFGVFLRQSHTRNVTIQPKGTATNEGFLFIEQDSIVDGTVLSSVGDVRVDGSQVTGNVTTTGALYTDVRGSFVDGTLSVSNNPSGSVVCGSAIQGVATFAGNLGGVQLGPNGALSGCSTGGYFARDVSISNTTGAVRVDDNIINGKLMFATNSPMATVAPNNRIRGGIVGDHQAPTASSTLAAPNRDSKADRVKDRLAKASKAASVKRASLR